MVPTGMKPSIKERREDPYEMRNIPNVPNVGQRLTGSSRFAGDDITTPSFDRLVRRNEESSFSYSSDNIMIERIE